MREIKFRAWDNENQRMIKARPYRPSIVTSEQQDLYTSGTDSTQLVISLKGVVGNVWPGPDSYGLVSNVEFDVQDYILLQYTGLKDKNGVEIYEGDIVNITTNWISDLAPNSPTTTSTEAVEFVKGSFQLGHGGFFSNSFIEQGELEVIGNIYENQELLKEEKS